MDIEKLLKREFARRDVYATLAECYTLPEKKLILRLKNMETSLDTLASDALTQIALMRSEIQGKPDIQYLKIDYAKLFVGPYSLLAPPYGSVYLEGKRRIMGDSTVDIQKRYAEAGLTTSEKFKEIPDHICAELEFIYFLIFKEIVAIQNGSFETVLDILRKQRSFLQDHLYAWAKDLTRKIETHSQTNFYRYLALATRIFIEEDFTEIVNLKIPEPNVAVNQVE